MKITSKQFELFKKEVLKWIDFFGLKGWQINFLFKKLNGNRAQIHYNCVSGIATFILNKDWDEIEIDPIFITNEAIRRSGFHEVCELFLGRLADMTDQRYGLIELDVEEETHRIIRTLENVLWKAGN